MWLIFIAVLLGSFQVDVHIALGIDHDRFPLRRQHVGIERQTTQVKLFEVHRRRLSEISMAVSLLH